MGFADGRGEGGSIKELYKKGLVEPTGRVGRRVRWRLVNNKLTQRDIDLMNGLVKQVSLPAEQEGLIVELLGEAKDLSILIADNIGSKGTQYLLQSFFLVLRQMGYFFTEGSSPLLHYGSSLSEPDKDILIRVKDIRDGIGHRESEKNFLTANFKLIGGMNFKDGDVEIQYGRNKVYLVGEIFSIHKKMRRLFSSVESLAFLNRSYGWNRDENELQEAEANLKKKLKNPQALLGLASAS